MSRSRDPMAFMGNLVRNPSTQTAGLGSSSQYEISNSIVAEAMD